MPAQGEGALALHAEVVEGGRARVAAPLTKTWRHRASALRWIAWGSIALHLAGCDVLAAFFDDGWIPPEHRVDMDLLRRDPVMSARRCFEGNLSACKGLGSDCLHGRTMEEALDLAVCRTAVERPVFPHLAYSIELRSSEDVDVLARQILSATRDYERLTLVKVAQCNLETLTGRERLVLLGALGVPWEDRMVETHGFMRYILDFENAQTVAEFRDAVGAGPIEVGSPE
ncbi:MAG: hypothetical protein H6732_13105 [Alphaproteobacteria bacterium]|nr:hypothetical protein [Alphaproteobacteria bacterium]